jgi:hypothetical protein
VIRLSDGDVLVLVALVTVLALILVAEALILLERAP